MTTPKVPCLGHDERILEPAMARESGIQRTMGLAGATGVGVGAIVGGGILAMAGVAFSATGPSAMLAFALNGIIALLTALSFAEMAAAFPESGGTYTFAKKVLNVRIAFAVGWVVCLASLVAAVLYALGLASFLLLPLREIWPRLFGSVPGFLQSRWAITFLAVLSTLWFSATLLRKSGGGGHWLNVTKSAVFALVIAGGLWGLTKSSGTEIKAHLMPFFPGGATGLFQAMGFTFIALQGFDLIAAVGGEVKNPGRNIPKAMIGSLLIALLIYLPLLFVIATVGVGPGETVAGLGRAQPEGIVAIAARRFLGGSGYWLVIAAGILSMLSALRANLFAASRVAFAMARDRTLSPMLGRLDPQRRLPTVAVLAVAAIVILILILVPDVATAGAASSLIFLITFSFAHYINIVLRRRMDPAHMPFRVGFFPLVPIVGGASCLGLAFFQGVSVPAAGVITVIWLSLGAGLYAFRFAGRAQIFDASAEGVDPLLIKYRGRNPLILLPVDDAENVGSIVAVANAVSPPDVGRVLLLSVVQPPETWVENKAPPSLHNMEVVQREALTASFSSGLAPEALLTIASNHWAEILRVSRLHRCEAILLGLRSISEQASDPGFNELLSHAPCDTILLRCAKTWRFNTTRRILIPIGGRGSHSPLRARVLGSLRRETDLEVQYVCFLPQSVSDEALRRARKSTEMRVEDEMGRHAAITVERCNDPAAEIIRRAPDHDLVILGLQQLQARRRAISDFALRIAGATHGALLLLGHKTE
jgi:basic amino acid/polyamine antiporter, APA family